MKNMIFQFIVFSSMSISQLAAYEISQVIKQTDGNKKNVELTFELKPNEYLLKDSLSTISNNPAIHTTDFTTQHVSEQFFDESSKTKKEGYAGVVLFSMTAENRGETQDEKALVRTNFRVNTKDEIQSHITELDFSNAPDPVINESSAITPTTAASIQHTATEPRAEDLKVPCEPQNTSLLGSLPQRSINWVTTAISKTKETFTNLFSETSSRPLRFLAALILGLLLSLTPCIYPMIPITIGILQASGTPSAWKNFILALCYTLGISTTFAVLGFIAALGSCVFGELQGSPFFVIPLALLLLYFALTMFDVVQLKIPQWMQPKTKVKGGSKLSAFIFGAVSGTVASPCISPGLILILHYVTKVSATSFTGYFEGFLLLFIFGIGSSIPLLIIGTFSGSLSVLPKAGMWMVEVKKLVGIMLIGMALYQLSHLERLLPWHIFAWVVAFSFLALGIYYFASIASFDKKWMRRYKNFMGVALILTSCLTALKAQRALVDYWYPEIVQSPWLNDINKAEELAKSDKKALFIDIGATYCSACKALDSKIFSQKEVLKALSAFTLLKIDSDVHTEGYERVKALYGSYIDGFPTYLLVDPTTNKVLKKWSIELDELSLQGVIELFSKTAASLTDGTRKETETA